MASIVRTDQLRSTIFSQVTIVVIALFMVVFGSIMVVSASSISLMEAGLPLWQLGLSQLIFGVVGVVAMFVISNCTLKTYERLALPCLLVVDVLLIATWFFGDERLGNKNWISIGSFSLQPSEFAKIFLCVWLGLRLGKFAQTGEIEKIRNVFNWKMLLGIFGTLGLVLIGQDLGTAMIFMVMLIGEFFIAGVPGRYLGAFVLVVSALAGAFVMTSENRRTRILGNYTNCGGDMQGVCYQSIHGLWALASGGVTGVGPGASREKWSYLPEAHNDFIYAIIGEEIGLTGTIVVIICYLLLTIAMVMVMVRVTSIQARVIIGGILCWICRQALFNIGAVLRLLPVVGVPSPLISYGGTSMIATLMGLGVVLSFTKQNKGAGKLTSKNTKGITAVVAG